MLITQNRTSEYYCELERLTLNEKSNEYIQIPINIEKQFMDGNYLKFISSTKKIPRPEYEQFITKLIDTIRNEAARSFEKSCKSIRLD